MKYKSIWWLQVHPLVLDKLLCSHVVMIKLRIERPIMKFLHSHIQKMLQLKNCGAEGAWFINLVSSEKTQWNQRNPVNFRNQCENIVLTSEITFTMSHYNYRTESTYSVYFLLQCKKSQHIVACYVHYIESPCTFHSHAIECFVFNNNNLTLLSTQEAWPGMCEQGK